MRLLQRCCFLLILSLCIYCFSCAADPTGGGGGKAVSTPDFVRGVSLSPKGFPATYNKLEDFYAEVGDWGHACIQWNGAWRDDVVAGSDAGNIPAAALATLDGAEANEATASLVVGWRSGTTLFIKIPGNTVNSWINLLARQKFREMLVSLVQSRDVAFLFLGSENDIYYEQDSGDYLNWLEFYEGAYDAIKAASPKTLVGPIFSYEHISGNGTLNGWSATTFWEALELHDLSKIDIVGLTLYPFLQYAHANDIPDDYLAPLFSRIGSKPVAVTETGWPAEDLGSLHPLWSTGADEQSDLIAKLPKLFSGRDLRLANWLFLYQMINDGSASWKTFGSISLRDGHNEKHSAYADWTGL